MACRDDAGNDRQGEVHDESRELRAQADAAFSRHDLHQAVALYTQAINSSRARLKETVNVVSTATFRKDPSWQLLHPLCSALTGRARALLEMGRPCGKLEAKPEILTAAIADARAALTLARCGGRQSDVAAAVVCLSDVLIAAGQAGQGKAVVMDALAADPESVELRGLATTLERRELADHMDAEADDGHSPGTFRWPGGMPFPMLPPIQLSILPPCAVSDQGWGVYLRARGGEPLLATARAHAMLLDGLSFPLSLGWVLMSSSVKWSAKKSACVLHVVVLGATSKAEGRIWQQSAYWQELEHVLGDRCSLCFEFVGPEIDDLPDRIHRLEPPCAKQFFSSRSELTPANTVCVIYNGGFGNLVASGRDDLLWSWFPDLAFLARSGFLCVFFCANDYADLRGEVAVHTALLSSRFVLAPCRNPFSMATVYSGEPDGEGAKEWFCGNAFAYATCGCGETAHNSADHNINDTATRRQMLAEVLAKAPLVGNSVEVDGSVTPRLLYGMEDEGDYPSVLQGVAATSATSVMDSTSKMFGKGCVGEQTADAGVPADRHSRSIMSGIGMVVHAASAEAHVTLKTMRSAPDTSVSYTLDDGHRWVRFEIHLPGVSNIDHANLQISDARILLKDVGGFALEEDWPEHVEAVRARAFFSVRKGRLVIQAPVREA